MHNKYTFLTKCLSLIVLMALSFTWVSMAEEEKAIRLGLDVTLEDTEALSLKACVQRALRYNLNIQVQRLDWEIAYWTKEREKDAFIPSLVASAEREENKRRNTIEETLSQVNPFFDEENINYSAAIEGRLPLGTEFRLGYDIRELSNNLTNRSARAPFDSEFVTFAGLSITQPLLKNAGLKANLAGVRIASARTDMSLQDFRTQLMTIISRTEAAYWDLVLAQQQFEMRSESVEIAQKILSDNSERVKAGKMAELEVIQAEAGLARRLAQQSRAFQSLREAMNQLKTLFSEHAIDSRAGIVATDIPAILNVPLDYEQSMVSAFSQHPAYLKQLKEVEEQNVRLALAKNLRWPQLDLTASYGLNGLGDTADSSWDDIDDASFEAWSLGLAFTVPLGGWAQDKTQLEIAKYRQRQALLNLKSVEIAIGNTLETAIRKVRDTKERIYQYRIVKDADQRLLDVELSRLQIGKSDSRKVLEIEEDLFDAKNIYIQSMNEYQKALLDLEAIKGTVLFNRNIKITEIETDKQGEAFMGLIEDQPLTSRLRPASINSSNHGHQHAETLADDPEDLVPKVDVKSERLSSHSDEMGDLDIDLKIPLKMRLHVLPVRSGAEQEEDLPLPQRNTDSLEQLKLEEIVPLR